MPLDQPPETAPKAAKRRVYHRYSSGELAMAAATALRCANANQIRDALLDFYHDRDDLVGVAIEIAEGAAAHLIRLDEHQLEAILTDVMMYEGEGD